MFDSRSFLMGAGVVIASDVYFALARSVGRGFRKQIGDVKPHTRMDRFLLWVLPLLAGMLWPVVILYGLYAFGKEGIAKMFKRSPAPSPAVPDPE